MILKTNLNSIILTGFLAIVIITSCVPKVQKPDDAFDLLKKERMLLDDSSFVSEKIIAESLKTIHVKKIEIPDEWTQFQTETENKIRLNEKTIKEIKRLPHLNSGLLKKVANLEENNSDLRIKMKEYKEEVKVKWETFKVSINHNVNEIAIALNDLETNGNK